MKKKKNKKLIGLLAPRCQFFPSLNIKLTEMDTLDGPTARKIVCPKKRSILSYYISTTKNARMSGQYKFSA